MTVHLACDKDRESIDGYVMNCGNSALYHLYSWKTIIESCFKNRCYYLYSKKASGEVNGVLPLVHIKSHIFGNYFVSMPYFNYGGVCADDEESREKLLKEAIQISAQKRGKHIEFRQDILLGNHLPYKSSKVSMRLTLPATSRDLWESFPSKLRNQIRRPEREGMDSRIGGEEELDSFYDVFSNNMRDLGTPVYSKRLFASILRTYPGKAFIVTIYFRGKPLASGFLIGFKDKMEIPWASSLRKYNHLSPNMLLYWNCMKFSCEQGYDIFDFGRSTSGEGTYRFKEQWGARPVQLYWHYWLAKETRIPELNPNNPKYKFAIAAWRKLPLPVTKWIGPYIVKKLP